MLVTSRSYAEYEAMFDLTELPDSVLDCCAGGAGFTAEAAARGVDAIAADPAYELEPAELVDTVRRSLPATAGIVDEHAGSFVWHWYGIAGAEGRATDRGGRRVPAGRGGGARAVCRGRPAGAALRGQAVRAGAVLAPVVHLGRQVRPGLAPGRVARADPGAATREVRIFPLVHAGRR